MSSACCQTTWSRQPSGGRNGWISSAQRRSLFQVSSAEHLFDLNIDATAQDLCARASSGPKLEVVAGNWKRMPELDRIIFVRTLRPDRLTAALSRFVAGNIGQQYVTSQPFSLERSFQVRTLCEPLCSRTSRRALKVATSAERCFVPKRARSSSPPLLLLQDAAPGIPILAFLSPGVDVAASVEALGRKHGFTADAGKYASVSLGQGQEPIAMKKLEEAHTGGGWVLLQNIHLTMDWTSGPLEKAIDKLSEGAHPHFRSAPQRKFRNAERTWQFW